MGILADRITAALTDLDAAVQVEMSRPQAELDRLATRRAALAAALANLKSLGVLRGDL